METGSHLLTILDEDSLRQVLLRTCASDHFALQCTCRQLSSVLNSGPFRKERVESEWAEVKAALLEVSRSDDDDSDSEIYGAPSGSVLQREFRVQVDGRQAGSGNVTLVSRSTNYFHEICDNISTDLQSVGCLLFDTRGRPRVASFKKAIDSQPDNHKGLLYINDFKWDPVDYYRENSWLSATAIRLLLLRDTCLRNNWSVAIYIPDRESHLTDEDRQTSRDIQSMNRAGVRLGSVLHDVTGDSWQECLKNDEEQQKRDDWEKRCLYLAERDMKPFLRAGFRQVKETALKTIYYQVFAVPAFLESPIILSEETIATEMIKRPRPTKGVNKKFLDFIRDACSSRRRLNDTLQNAPPSEEQVNRFTDLLIMSNSRMWETVRPNGTVDKARAAVESLREQLMIMNDCDPLYQVVQEHIQTSTDLVHEMERTSVEMRANVEETVRLQLQLQASTVTAETEVELAALTSKIRTGTKRFVDEAGASLKDSHVAHACAGNHDVETLDLLLEFAPQSERPEILDHLDHSGLTPLIVAAGVSLSSPEKRYRMLVKLINLGADKNIVDASGETALGSYRERRRSVGDFHNVYHLSVASSETQMGPEFHARFESLLRPSGGPTRADDAYLLVDGNEEAIEDDDEHVEDDNASDEDDDEPAEDDNASDEDDDEPAEDDNASDEDGVGQHDREE
jgi:hypothetical protein